jgi:hypothetical protein
MTTEGLTEFVWNDPNPRGGCYLCRRPLRRLDDAVHLMQDAEPTDGVTRLPSGKLLVGQPRLGVAHAQCAKKAGHEVFREVWGVIRRVRV